MNDTAEEWNAMSEQTRNEISARLHQVIEDIDRREYRARLANASRPSARLAQN